MNKSQAAFQFSTERLSDQGLYMWTFTFSEVLDIKDTRKRWNHLLTLLRRRWPNLAGLRVFELHKTHGLHVHLLTNRYIRVEEARKLAKIAGWGRIHVCRAKKDAANYLAKYLSKEREPCLKRWRLWAGFGNWDWSRVKNTFIESPRSLIWKSCAIAFQWKGKRGFQEKHRITEWLYHRTIQEGWTYGLGPQNRSYQNCTFSELTGFFRTLKNHHSSIIPQNPENTLVNYLSKTKSDDTKLSDLFLR